ncbi:hypothetical protein ACQY1M_00130 [Neorhizobium sp. DAR64861/K0K2]|uniref:hypothetical protein n=1 Tax=Neorhizobium sp. DAR64861/K0K2 TaxID=3421956 RepID=UPI003D2D6BFA
MKERVRLVLIIGASKMECYRTAKTFDLDFLKVDRMRFVCDPYHLLGWSRGTAFIALNRPTWPESLDLVLQALTVKGQLRIANDRDLAELRADIPSAALSPQSLQREGARR